jgi:hypothetical protein
LENGIKVEVEIKTEIKRNDNNDGGGMSMEKLRYRWFCECGTCISFKTVYTQEDANAFVDEHNKHASEQYRLGYTTVLAG